MDSKNSAQQSEPTLCFEEYRDCFGEPGEVLKRHLLCTLCGGHLHMNHLADFKNGIIQETARCPDCGVRIRQRLHKIQ
jgi:hypothetical protein